ncbi:hypothetical protein [Raineyella fluvialis]|uniref:Subtilisin inhibitor-like n=1 Tax=Raineyella fluvialis TaxID=2662261 RepID=A0A5Q2F7K0_9ACTN|nr:hypothetical protein [Raineyella fluvialis]QGF22970.1 hypothetical protein Rai3103_04010 [Raineyella fluvialis]
MRRLSPAMLLVALTLPLAGCATGSQSMMATPKPQTPPPATMVHLADLRTGMCVDGDRLPRDGKVAYLEVLACDLDHTGEVFAVLDNAGCPAAYQAYVGAGSDHSTNQIRVLTASADAWDRAGSPPTVCVAVAPTPITGSLRGTGR